MAKQLVKVSSYLPSYLKLDLNVGMNDEHPFIAALDATMERICGAAQAEAFSMTRSHFPLERKRASLEGSGFDLTGLTDAQVERLYATMGSLFRSQGTLGNVTELCAVYFGDAASGVRRGRPLERRTVGTKISFPMTVGDRDGIDRTLFITLGVSFSEALKAAFINSLKTLIPHGYEVIFQEPSSSQREGAIRFDFTQPSRLSRWRL